MDLIEQTKNLIDNSKSILVVTGAGISTGAGIPDFRSENGLYEIVRKRFNIEDPTLIFDVSYFVHNPSMFYQVAPALSKEYEPTIAHKYIASLEENHNVVVLTQNIDGLHEKAGSTNVICAHGTMSEAYCLTCGHKEYNPPYDGRILFCELCGGLMKPSVVFFSESLPETFYNFSYNWKNYNFDLMIVIGTGLEVYPVAGLVLNMSRVINTIYITKVGNPLLITKLNIMEDIQKFFKKLARSNNNPFKRFSEFLCL